MTSFRTAALVAALAITPMYAFAMTTDQEKPAATSKAPETRGAEGGGCRNGCLDEEDFGFDSRPILPFRIAQGGGCAGGCLDREDFDWP